MNFFTICCSIFKVLTGTNQTNSNWIFEQKAGMPTAAHSIRRIGKYIQYFVWQSTTLAQFHKHSDVFSTETDCNQIPISIAEHNTYSDHLLCNKYLFILCRCILINARSITLTIHVDEFDAFQFSFKIHTIIRTNKPFMNELKWKNVYH